MNWYYSDGNKAVGPLAESTMVELRNCGMLSAETHVCQEGTETWMQYDEAFKKENPSQTSDSTAEPESFIRFDCPHCQQSSSTPLTDSGLRTVCRVCGGEIVVPAVRTNPEVNETSPSLGGEEQPVNTERIQEPAKDEFGSSFAGRLKKGAMGGWSSIKRHSKGAALKAQIEKLKNVDLRKAHYELGKTCFELGLFESELQAPFQAIRALDATIAEKRLTEQAAEAETMIASFTRKTKDAAKHGHANALGVKRQLLLAELGKSAYGTEIEDNSPIQAELHAVSRVLERLQALDEEAASLQESPEAGSANVIEGLSPVPTSNPDSPALPDTVPASVATPVAAPFSMKSLVPIFICCLGFGWVIGRFLPDRYFLGSGVLANIFPVMMLAIPSVTIIAFGMLSFLRPTKVNWGKSAAALLFTMFLGVIVLFRFHDVASAFQELGNKNYGKANAVFYSVKAIGWLGQYTRSENLFMRILAHTFNVGLCEEITKLLPLILVVLLSRKNPERPPLSEFLLLGFFSGLGFGISEALYTYAPWGKIPTHAVGGNVVRWFACVPMHAIYTVIDTAFLWILIPPFKKAKSKGEALGILVAAALVIAIVHGIYNTIADFHYLLGLSLDGLAIGMMALVVRHCARQEFKCPIQSVSISPIIRLPHWLLRRSSGQPAFGRMFAIAGAFVLGSLAFADKSPQSSLAETIRHEFGVKLDQESAIVYAMGYSIGSNANRPTSQEKFEEITNETMRNKPDVNPAFAKLILAGIDDGYNHRPNRLEGIDFDSLEPPRNEEGGSGGAIEYKVNQDDRQILKKFDGVFATTSKVGKRNRLNDLEIILAAIDAMDWTGASPQLRNAVKEMQSIESGEAPDSRNMKMKRFMDICDKY